MAVPKQKPGRSQQTYETPEIFLAPTRRLLGVESFDFDFAAHRANVAEWYYDETANALAQPHWEAQLTRAGWGWLNPPFARIAPWAAKCAETRDRGGSVAFLVPAAVGSDWFAHHVWQSARVLLLRGRIPFMPERPTWGYPKDCILALYSPRIKPGISMWDWREEDLAFDEVTKWEPRRVAGKSIVAEAEARRVAAGVQA